MLQTNENFQFYQTSNSKYQNGKGETSIIELIGRASSTLLQSGLILVIYIIKIYIISYFKNGKLDNQTLVTIIATHDITVRVVEGRNNQTPPKGTNFKVLFHRNLQVVNWLRKQD